MKQYAIVLAILFANISTEIQGHELPTSRWRRLCCVPAAPAKKQRPSISASQLRTDTVDMSYPHTVDAPISAERFNQACEALKGQIEGLQPDFSVTLTHDKVRKIFMAQGGLVFFKGSVQNVPDIHPDPYFFLEKIAIDSRYRRQGLATAVLCFLLNTDVAHYMGYKAVVAAPVTRGSEALFKKLDFQEIVGANAVIKKI